MKTAVVFYSYDGHGAFVAEELKTRLNADLVRLYAKDEKKRQGFAKYAWGGSLVIMHKKPDLKPYVFDAAAYDLIIIGAPVWAGSPAPPIQTFLSESTISKKNVAFFLCHAGGKGKAMDKFRTQFAGNTIIGEADFLNPGNNETKQLIEEWAARISAR
jgi:flavodoxin